VVDTNVRRFVARAIAGAPDAGPTTTARDLASVAELLPDEPELAARASVAFMELGALVCTARNPRCTECPVATTCEFRRSGAVAPVGPTRRPQRYAGTDRQVRGLLLAVLRESSEPVPRARLDTVWPDAVQRDRALSGLLADGLACEVGHNHLGLPRSVDTRIPYL
jgi:A/G-specific adenine glycosylase